MEVLLKILLSTSIIYAISFVFKTFTTNKFDRVFMPKHQKSLQNTFLIVFLIFVFILYGIYFAALYQKIIELRWLKHTSDAIETIYFIYFIGILYIVILCLMKFINRKNKEWNFKISEKTLNKVFFTVFLLNIFVYSIMLHDVYFSVDTNRDKNIWISNMISCIFVFLIFSYLLMKSNSYLLGISKRHWKYVLSPTPADIKERHLYVLYSLTPTTLVLSDNPESESYPTSVYLYDLNKNTYVYFNRVVNLQ